MQAGQAGENNSLLILTRTRTDAAGRRHSVAVPLLAAPAQPDPQQGVVVERRLGGPAPHRRLSLQPGTSPARRPSARTKHTRRPSKQGENNKQLGCATKKEF